MRSRTLARLPVLFALFALGAALAVVRPGAADTATPPELDLLTRINEARADHGLRPLTLAPRLQSDAEGYAGTLSASGRFVHGYLRRGTGELIAWGSPGTMGARQIARRWLASPEHDRLLLMPRARWIGVGIVFGQLDGERLRVAVVRISV